MGNCGFFKGKSFTYNVDDCRAGGSALAFALRQGNAVSLVNSTLTGHGDCLLTAECDDGNCNGSETITLQNNIFIGNQEFMDPNDGTCYIWFDKDGATVTFKSKTVKIEGGFHAEGGSTVIIRKE